MAIGSMHQKGVRKPRQRSSIACQPCNSRRVKCNAASGGVPCGNCQRAGRECQLIESRRGKKKSKPSAANIDHSAESSAAPADDGVVAASSQELQDTHEGSQGPDGDHSTPELRRERSNALEDENVAERRGEDVDDEIHHDGEGPEMLYAQMLEADKSRSKQRKLMKPGGQVVYLGETFNLTYLLHETLPEEQTHRHRLHYPLPVDVTESSNAPETHAHDGLDILQLQNAFDIPSSHVCFELFRAYFEHVQPHYPIVDRGTFLVEYADPRKPPSWLLLQAILFMAAGHCEEALLKEAGFTSRYDARRTLFKRTKALYDADHEKDKITIVQAVFLMSFWWATPVDSKDTWHWLGIAISLALTIGMHRSTKDSGMALKDQRLWKRIWWSLFAEDKHAAAALGRPVHTRLNDCDVEELELSDFEGETSSPGDSFGAGPPKVHEAYVIHLSRLSKIVERIIEKSSQMSGSQNNSLELCEGMLQVWESGIPEVLRLDAGKNDSIWPSMLHIAACWFRVLAHRTRAPNDPSTPSRDDAHQKAMDAANQMVRIVEDLLSSGQIQHCPIHIIPALFAAMSMLAIKIRSGDQVSQQLAYVKVKLCMIALRELQSSWPVSGWILLLFAKIVRGIRDEDDLKADQRATKKPISNAHPGRTAYVDETARHLGSTPHSEGSSQAPPFAPAPALANGGPMGYNTSDSVLPQRATMPNNQSYPMPLDFSTDWSGVRDEDLWLVPGFDFLGELPRMNDFSGYSGT